MATVIDGGLAHSAPSVARTDANMPSKSRSWIPLRSDVQYWGQRTGAEKLGNRLAPQWSLRVWRVCRYQRTVQPRCAVNRLSAETLALRNVDSPNARKLNRAPTNSCNVCPLREQCTSNRCG